MSFLYKVYEFVLPDDLENFAQSCKSVRSLAGPVLEQHRALIREYNTIRNYEPPRAIRDLLIGLLRNPLLGRYVEELDLAPLGPEHLSQEWQSSYSSEDMALFSDAASLHLHNCGALEWRWKHSRRLLSCSPMLLTILVASLPNLASILLSSGDLRYQAFLDSLINGPMRNPLFLPKLRTVVVRPETPEYMSRGCDLPTIQILGAIPSIRTITAFGAEDAVTAIQVTRPQLSNVTHLNLLETSIGARVFFYFIRGFTNLESLRYSSDYIEMSTSDPFLVRSGLVVATKNTLRFLTLLMPSSKKSGLMGSLREFEKLEFLETEWDFLIANQTSPFVLPEPEVLASIKRIILHDREPRKLHQYQKWLMLWQALNSVIEHPILSIWYSRGLTKSLQRRGQP